jgi:dsDNA-specific endonuclease/ATPase MutS2
MKESMKEDEIIQFPIEDSIDLHTFRPNEVKELLNDYLEAASEKGFEEVRIIHGKGTGTLRRIVHAVLGSHPLVISFREASPKAGGWGATIAVLKRAGLNRTSLPED